MYYISCLNILYFLVKNFSAQDVKSPIVSDDMVPKTIRLNVFVFPTSVNTSSYSMRYKENQKINRGI